MSFTKARAYAAYTVCESRIMILTHDTTIPVTPAPRMWQWKPMISVQISNDSVLKYSIFERPPVSPWLVTHSRLYTWDMKRHMWEMKRHMWDRSTTPELVLQPWPLYKGARTQPNTGPKEPSLQTSCGAPKKTCCRQPDSSIPSSRTFGDNRGTPKK